MTIMSDRNPPDVENQETCPKVKVQAKKLGVRR